MNKMILFCCAKLIELLVLLRRNILRQINFSEAKKAFSLLLRRRIFLCFLIVIAIAGCATEQGSSSGGRGTSSGHQGHHH